LDGQGEPEKANVCKGQDWPKSRTLFRHLPQARTTCRAFRDNAVRLQLFALAHNLAELLRSLVLPNEVPRSLVLPNEVPRPLFVAILRRIERLRGSPVAAA
jgi:hypothetical protein